MATDWRRLVTARDVKFGGYVQVKLRVNRRGGTWRQRLGFALRRLADKVDGRDSLQVEVDAWESFSGDAIELSRAELHAACGEGMQALAAAAQRLAVERRIDDEMLRARPELRG